MRIRYIVLLAVTGFFQSVHAESLSFPAVWSQINQGSPAQEASRLQTEVMISSQSRAEKHWLPRVYIDAKSYQTNDPGASFLGVLEQRSLQQSDFNSDLINHPESRLYTRGALGVDLALFEGGMKSAQVDLFKYSVEAQKSASAQVQIEQYAQVGLAYGSLLVLAEKKDRLQTLSREIAGMLKKYQLGSKSNPLGYSGLLGMKSLQIRLTGLINQYQAQSRSYYAGLKEMGLQEANWSPGAGVNISGFVKRYFSLPEVNSSAASSYRSESTKQKVAASLEMANMEKAKSLPRFGAFAESFVFSGDRAQANGYNAGIYLQWNLFDPADYGSFGDAKLKAQVAAKSSEAADQQERAERAALFESVGSLKENIGLLNESYQLLLEQSKMTETLFRNGSINTLQIVEILSRRADVIAQQAQAELALIAAAAMSVTKSKFDISGPMAEQSADGVGNEN